MASILYDELNTSKYDGRYYTLLMYDLEQSIENNSSTLTWELVANGGNSSWYAERTLKVSINGSIVYSKTDRYQRYEGTIATGEITIKHNTNGTKQFFVSVEAAVYGSDINVSGAKYIDLEPIARQATITFAPNFFDTDNPTINYSNPMGGYVEALEACISLTGAADDIAYRSISKTGTSYTFNLTEDERNILRNASPNSNTLSLRFYVRTILEGKRYLNFVSATMSIINNNPTFTVSVVDTNSATVALTGDNSKCVKHHSNLKYTIAATALKGASISKYIVSNGSNTLNTSSGTFSSIETNIINVSVVDSRGNTTKKTITPAMVSYIPLTCNIETNNISTSGDMEINISGNYFNNTFGAVSNSLIVYYRVYVAGATNIPNYTTAATELSGNTYKSKINVSGLDYRVNYVVEAYAADELLDNVVAIPYQVSSHPIFDWSETDFNFNVPITINGVSLLDLIYPIGSVFYTNGDTSPADTLGGEWEALVLTDGLVSTMYERIG